MRRIRSVWSDGDLVIGGRMTYAVRLLLIVTLSVFILQLIFDQSRFPGRPGHLTSIFGLWAQDITRGYLWQLVTYMFLHSTTNILHIIVNMLVLFLLGPETERSIGTKHFFILYFLTGILGGLGWVLVGGSRPCIGASGAIFGILGAFAALYPNRPMTLLIFFVFPVTMRAWILVAGLGLIQLFFLLSHTGGNIAYVVHLAGGLAGFIYAVSAFRTEVIGQVKNLSQYRLRRAKKAVKASGVTDTRVDALLDKIAEEGIGSLSNRERSILQKASRERNGR